MAIQGALGFRLNDIDHIFYNNFESQPSDLGSIVVEFVHGRVQDLGYDGFIVDLKHRVGSLLPVDPNVPPSIEQKKWCQDLGLVDLTVNKRSLDDWYCLLRGAQGDIEKLLTARYYEPSDDFLLVGLFCEYAYIIDLDAQALEFHQGFQKRDGRRHPGRYWRAVPSRQLKPFEERFKGPRGSYSVLNEYGPVALRLTMPLSEVAGAEPADVVARLDRATRWN